MEIYKLLLDNAFLGNDIFKQEMNGELFNYLSNMLDQDYQATYVNDVSLIDSKLIFQLLVNDFTQSKEWNTDHDPWIEIIFDLKKEKFIITGIQQ